MKASADPKAFQAACAAYCEGMEAGKGSKAMLAETGLSHAQADLAWYCSPLNPNMVTQGSVTLPTVPNKNDQGYEVALRQAGLVVAELYAGTHASYPGRQLSWGQIGIVTSTTESTVRRMFKATGLSDQGMRKGKGGRWLGDEPRAYLGTHKAHGIQDATPRAVVNATYVAKADEWTPVLPKAVEQLRTQLKGKAKVRARKATTARKQAEKEAIQESVDATS